VKILKISELLKEGTYLNKYKESISRDKFKELLDFNCKGFNFSDRVLIRGDKNLGDDFYYINPKFRKVNWNWTLMYPLHLEFLRSKLWDELPKKVESIDMLSPGGGDGLWSKRYIKGLYGDVYRVIPFDGAVFVKTEQLTGNYNKILSNDIGNCCVRAKYLSEIINSYVVFNKKYNEHTSDMKEISKNLNILFKDYDKVVNYNNRIILKTYQVLKDRNMSFIDYMEYAFSPDSYEILNYNEVMKGSKFFVWTDSEVLLIKESINF